MSKFKFKLNPARVAELMKSSEMQQVLTAKATAIRQRCGDGYAQDIHVGKNRANAMVSAKTIKFMVLALTMALALFFPTWISWA
ncbi:hypothetical protein [Streptococcus equi]|uniref:hypothetical protein n=1 Tax=Streptococcus equi TaxID=1336 RepID=UPI002F2B6B07